MDLGLYQLKYPIRRLIAGVLPAVKNVHPNVVSWSILPVGVVTAGTYFWSSRYPFLLLIGVALILLRMFLATLDGLMAVQFGKSSPSGEIANRVPAEISDVLLLLALTCNGHALVGPVAIAIGWLTSFSGLVGLAANGPPQSVGPAGSTDRLAALIVFSAVAFIAGVTCRQCDALGWFLWWVVLGGAVTVTLRLVRTFRSSGHAADDATPR